MQYARRVALAYFFRSLLKEFIVEGFIAERPYYDARMVFVALYHIVDSVPKGGAPALALHKRGLFAHAVEVVHFDIGFVYDIHAKLVAKFVEVGAVGIVGGSDSVDIVFFHLQDVAP